MTNKSTVHLDPSKLFGLSQAVQVTGPGATHGPNSDLHSKASEVTDTQLDLHSKAGEIASLQLDLHSKAGEVPQL